MPRNTFLMILSVAEIIVSFNGNCIKAPVSTMNADVANTILDCSNVNKKKKKRNAVHS